MISCLQGDDLEVVNVQTAENEKYECVIPESQASKDAVSFNWVLLTTDLT